MSERNKNDEMALKLLENLKAKKEEIKKLSGRPHYKTNMTFFYQPQNKNVNLNVVADNIELATYYGYIKNQVGIIVDAFEDLEIDATLEEPKIDGFTLEEWREDFKTRAGVINIRVEKEKLKAMEAKINKIVSKEKRDELELEMMAKDLGV
jgi:hypothetical protein